ncbi:unnamed protein product [Penicillium roqueforti FM164]|uniref:Genomic scaffold, ProqFM164S01 n=1 Tax=Penicillium roqueforti (strain FM164) TaxID=1365484 RepID=W6Q2P3_PENRF|nr:unnamed protein product [Penicillium roqueforti FM164]
MAGSGIHSMDADRGITGPCVGILQLYSDIALRTDYGIRTSAILSASSSGFPILRECHTRFHTTMQNAWGGKTKLFATGSTTKESIPYIKSR